MLSSRRVARSVLLASLCAGGCCGPRPMWLSPATIVAPGVVGPYRAMVVDIGDIDGFRLGDTKFGLIARLYSAAGDDPIVWGRLEESHGAMGARTRIVFRLTAQQEQIVVQRFATQEWLWIDISDGKNFYFTTIPYRGAVTLAQVRQFNGS